MDTIRKTILDVLLEKNRLTPTEAAGFDKLASNEEIEKKLIEDKLVSSEDIAKAYAICFDLPFIRLEDFKISEEAFKIIPTDLIEKYKIIAFEKNENKKIKIAIGAPSQLKSNPPSIISELKEKKGMTINLYITTPEDIQKVLIKFTDIPVTSVKDLEKEITQSQSQPQPRVQPQSQPQPQVHQLKTVDLKQVKISYDTISKFPVEISQKYQMIVFASPNPNLIQVAISDPTDAKVREILHFVRDRNEIAIEEFVAPPADIKEAIRLYYRKPVEVSQAPIKEVPKPLPEVAPVKSVTETPVQPKPEEVYEVHRSFSDKLEDTISKLNSPLPQESKIENIGDKIVRPDVTGIDTTSPISNAPVVPASPAPKVISPSERPKFIRRPIPYETQKDQQQSPLPPEESAANSVIAPENDLDKFLGQPVNDIAIFTNIVRTGNIPQILAATITLAVNMKASDIHIEAEGQDLRFRFRVDGILKDILKAPLPLHAALVSRIKILSRLKIDETRIPQDGRFDVRVQGHEIDLRVSTLPTVRGEKAALRILDKSQGIYTLEDLGFEGRNLKLLEENITKPYGVILSTGPTGSGKSTTLYSIIKKISSPAVNVITLEDPVEYEMPGINQCQVKPKIGFSFAEGLRSVLRQDPNIIMVGEIRDAETAGMATHAALTGHLVLTTLHTNDAAGALPRLTNMGIEPFLITSSINIVVGQRLVRKICPKCKREAHILPEMMTEIERELVKFNLPQPYVFYEGAGCHECNNGFSGRVGIYEVLAMSDKIESLAIARRPASEIKEAAVADGMITMKQDGLIKALKGITTISEILRITLAE